MNHFWWTQTEVVILFGLLALNLWGTVILILNAGSIREKLRRR